MTVLSTLAENRSNHRYLDLTAVTAICVRVLQEYPTTLACLKPALNVLDTISSKEAVLRLSDHCSVLHNVLHINLGSGVLCEQVVHICKSVAQESHVFRVQCIKSGMLQDLLEALTHHSNHIQLLFSACDVFISLSKEPLLENSALRLTIIDYTLHFASASVFASDPTIIAFSLQALESVCCMSLGCMQFFMKKQGFMHLATLLEEFNTCSEVYTACCDLIGAVCAGYSASRDVLAAGIIPRIVSLLTINTEVSLQKLTPCFTALRTISYLSVDCVKGLISAKLVPILLHVITSETEEIPVLESMRLLYQISMVDEGCEQLLQESITEKVGQMLTTPKPEDDLAIKRDLLLQNLSAYSKKRSRSTIRNSHNTPASPLDLSSVLESPLMGIMDVLILLDRHSENEVLINLKRLDTLCAAGRYKNECLNDRIECGPFGSIWSRVKYV